MYQRLFGVDKYHQVIKNLKQLLKINRDLQNRVKIHLTLRVETPYNKKKLESFTKFLSNYTYCQVNVYENEYDSWSGTIKKEDLPEGQEFRKNKLTLDPCYQLYDGLIIFQNGDVGPCWCRDYNAKLIVGNVNDESLEEIWKGKKLRRMRNNWKNGKIPSICINCENYSPKSDYLLVSKNHILGLNKKKLKKDE